MERINALRIELTHAVEALPSTLQSEFPDLGVDWVSSVLPLPDLHHDPTDLARKTACDLLRRSPSSSGLKVNGSGKGPIPCLGETGRPRSPLPDLVLQIPPGPLDLVVCDGCQKVLLRQCTARHAETCKAHSKLVLAGGETESSAGMMDVEAAHGKKKPKTVVHGVPQLRGSPPAPSRDPLDDDQQPGSPPLIPPWHARRRRSLTPRRRRQFSVEPEDVKRAAQIGRGRGKGKRGMAILASMVGTDYRSLAELAKDTKLNKHARGRSLGMKGSKAGGSLSNQQGGALVVEARHIDATARNPHPMWVAPRSVAEQPSSSQAQHAGSQQQYRQSVPYHHQQPMAPPSGAVAGPQNPPTSMAPRPPQHSIPNLQALTPAQRQQLILRHQLMLLRQQQQRQQQLGLSGPGPGPGQSLSPELALRVRQLLLLQQHAAALRQREGTVAGPPMLNGQQRPLQQHQATGLASPISQVPGISLARNEHPSTGALDYPVLPPQQQQNMGTLMPAYPVPNRPMHHVMASAPQPQYANGGMSYGDLMMAQQQQQEVLLRSSHGHGQVAPQQQTGWGLGMGPGHTPGEQQHLLRGPYSRRSIHDGPLVFIPDTTNSTARSPNGT